MPTSSPLSLPLAQSSTCRHAIRASDLVGPHEYADDVAPAEKRTGSSQSHTCKPNLLDCTHLPLIPTAFPLSIHNSGRMQAYSEAGISALIGEFSPFPSSQARQNPRMSPFYAFLSSLSIGEYTDLLPSYFFWYPYIYSSCNISSFLRMHIDAWILFSFCLIPSLVAGYSFGGDWYRNLEAIRERGHPLSRGLFNPVGLVALALAFKRPFLSTSSGLSPTFNPPIPSPSSGLSHTIPHHPDQMTLQSYCGVAEGGGGVAKVEEGSPTTQKVSPETRKGSPVTRKGSPTTRKALARGGGHCRGRGTSSREGADQVVDTFSFRRGGGQDM
ncbi:hypothetical protein EV121DRAFT_297412 [Schizophyllum commune]